MGLRYSTGPQRSITPLAQSPQRGGGGPMIRIAIGATEHGAAAVRACAGEVVVIGRDARCDLVIATPGVSATHCRLSPMSGVQGAYVLEDLGSSYGTYVNGTKVARPVVVSPRDAIVLGTQAIRIVAGDDDAGALALLSGAAAATTVAPTPGSAAPPRAPQAPQGPQAWADHYARFDALARAWVEAGRGRRGLLRGATLAEAEAWLAAGRDQQPAPQPIHRDLVRASKAATRRTALWIGAAATVVLASGAAGAWWWRQGDAAPTEVVEVTPAVEPGAAGPPQPSAAPDDAPTSWDLPALVRDSSQIADPDARLAVQAELARLPGSFLDDGRFALLAEVEAALADRRAVSLRSGTAAITTLAWTPAGHTLVTGDGTDALALWRLDAPSPTVPLLLLGHVGAITALAIAPDGRTLVSASSDRTLRRWDLQAEDPGASAAVLRGHEAALVACAVGPDGRWAVSGDALGTLRTWDLGAAVPADSPARTGAHEGPVTDLRFEPSGTVLSAGDDRMLRRWRIEPDGSLRPMTRFEGASSGLTRIALDRAGHRVIAGAADGSIALWEPRGSTTAPLLLVGHGDRVNDLVVTTDGRTLVSASDDDTLRVWDLGAADPSIASIVFAGHTGDVTAIRLAGADTRVLSAALDHGVRAWDLTKKDRMVDQVAVAEHAGAITALALAADGSLGASAGDDGEVRLWDPLARAGGQGGEVLRASASILVDGAITGDGRTLLAAGGEGRVELWPLADSARVPTPTRLRGATGNANAAAIDREGRRAAVGSDTGTILLWSLADADAPPKALGGHTRGINRLGFVGDGERLLSAGSDGTVRLWSTDGGAEPVVLRGHGDEIGTMAIADDGRWAVTGSIDGSLVRWDLHAEAIETSAVALAGHEGEVRTVAMSGDGRWLASGGADRRARLWSLADGRTTVVLRGHDEAISALAFGPGSRRLATGGIDGQLRVWDLEATHPDETARPLAGHTQTITDLVFVDDDVLASASNDGTVRLWQLASGEAIVLRGHDGPVKRLLAAAGPRADPGTRWLVSISYDGSARLWPTSGEALATRICEVIGAAADRSVLAALLGPRAPAPGCTAAKPG